MSGSVAHAPRPFLLRGSRGALCATYFAPSPEVPARGDVLVVPPFAEEMNRCRAMVTLQAQAWAAAGTGTLVLDPHGTGDSAGEFGEGDWRGWLDDLELGVAWLDERGAGCSALLGIRLGALMAAELAARLTEPVRLMLWQPVLHGKTFMTQFLRIRIAAEIEQADGVRSTEELRRMASAGGHVEVSGYPMAPALLQDIDRATMPPPAGLRATSIDCFEILPSAEATPSRAAAKFVEECVQAGRAARMHTVIGPPFWQVHEREISPALIDATARALDVLAADEHPAPGRNTGSCALELEPEHAPELPIVFECDRVKLVGIVHRPAGGKDTGKGVVIVVAGGPQYRAGAHRQFVNLARKLAARGVAVLRFDLRGMGDSGGSYLGFQQSAPDIRAAVDALSREHAGLREFVLFGECESASGILFYAWRDPRVQGAVLVNPWVRTEEGQAQVIIKHYYWDRLRSADFWRSVREGRYEVRQSLQSFVEVVRKYVRGRRQLARSAARGAERDLDGLPLPEKTAEGLRRFGGRVLLLMSGRDYIAREFDEVTALSPAWRGLLGQGRIVRRDLVDADHTFSRAEWKSTASDWVCDWVTGS
jgi:exosortase A-associated hydrolase 1/exosortase A-associated hydrolase 2